MAQLSHITTSSPRVITGICSRKVVVVVVVVAAAAAAVPTVVATVLVLLVRAETIIALFAEKRLRYSSSCSFQYISLLLGKNFYVLYCHARIYN